MTKYTKYSDDVVLIIDIDGSLKLACCDCGAVHIHAVLIKGEHHHKEACKQNGGEILKKGEIGLSIKKDERATAQLRRHKYGYLHNPVKGDKYQLKRIK